MWWHYKYSAINSDTCIYQTFSNDRQVTESGAGANAILAGTKINSGTLGVNTNVVRSDCGTVTGNEITGLLNWSMDEGNIDIVVA